jgi:hypothetical protein
MHDGIHSFAAGDRTTGKVYWDRDIRPSDATYLAEECGAPIYVDLTIWQGTAITHKEFLALEAAASTCGSSQQDSGGANSGTAATVELGGSVDEVPRQDGLHRFKNSKQAGGLARGDATASDASSRAGVLCAPFSSVLHKPQSCVCKAAALCM